MTAQSPRPPCPRPGDRGARDWGGAGMPARPQARPSGTPKGHHRPNSRDAAGASGREEGGGGLDREPPGAGRRFGARQSPRGKATGNGLAGWSERGQASGAECAPDPGSSWRPSASSAATPRWLTCPGRPRRYQSCSREARERIGHAPWQPAPPPPSLRAQKNAGMGRAEMWEQPRPARATAGKQKRRREAPALGSTEQALSLLQGVHEPIHFLARIVEDRTRHDRWPRRRTVPAAAWRNGCPARTAMPS